MTNYNCLQMTKTRTDAVADIALKLFAKKGYRETSIGDIEVAAGLTRRDGGFYRHFPSKQSVLNACLRRASTQLVSDIRLDEILARGNVREELLSKPRAKRPPPRPETTPAFPEIPAALLARMRPSKRGRPPAPARGRGGKAGNRAARR